MRRVEFEVYGPSDPGGTVVSGSVADLLRNVPYFLTTGTIPPLRVINELLRSGYADAGMSGGCRWEPFELDDEDWKEVLAALEGHPEGLRYVEPPADVTDRMEWQAWVFERLYGVPAQEHLALSRRMDELDALRDDARRSGDEEKARELHLEGVKVGSRLAQLVMEHLRGHRGNP